MGSQRVRHDWATEQKPNVCVYITSSLGWIPGNLCKRSEKAMCKKINYSDVHNSDNLEKTKCLPIDFYPFQIETVLYFQRIKKLYGN